MEVTAFEVKHYFSDLKKEIVEQQAYWEEIDPSPHAAGFFVGARRLAWYEEILPEIEDAIAAIEDTALRSDCKR